MTTTTDTASHKVTSKPVMTHRQILLVIYGLMAGMFLASLDQSIVGTAIRTIGDDLHGLDEQVWVTTAYLITSTITTPIYGKLSDIFGRRPLFIFAIVVFIAGSLASSFSTTMFMLAAFRAVQGIGAGALLSLPLAIMGDILAPRERAKYQGYFFAVFGVSFVIGPLIGGLFAGASQILFITGWRWVFLLNVPVGALALFMVITFLHLPRFQSHSAPRIDWWGATAAIVTLVPLLLVAEQGRTWGWGSAGSIVCYVLTAVGLVAFIVIEHLMKDDAIIPMRLFHSRTFSMATILGALVGFGMFGALLTIPLFLQIVIGLDPTQSGLALIPMVVGLMIAAIASGRILARTGKYRIFPMTGTAVTAIGYLLLTRISADTTIYYVMGVMFLIGLGLGQLMQTLTIASQNSVEPQQIGVATSAATFFRQIGGTLGLAVILSVVFSALPVNVTNSLSNKTELTSALSAALNPAVADAPKNKAVMDKLWNKTVVPLKASIQKELTAGAAAATKAADAAVTSQVTAAVNAQVRAGRIPAASVPTVIAQQVSAAEPGAEAAALKAVATKAHASVSGSSVRVDWSNSTQRTYWVDQLAPKIEKKLKTIKTSGSSSSDTSFLNGADSRLTRPFLVGFSESLVSAYWIGFGVMALAFILSLFFRTPPLRQVSGLQEQADQQAAADAKAATSDRPVDAPVTTGVVRTAEA